MCQNNSNDVVKIDERDLINPFSFLRVLGLDDSIKYHMVKYNLAVNGKKANLIRTYLESIPIEKYYSPCAYDKIKLATIVDITLINGEVSNIVGYAFFVEAHLIPYEEFVSQVDDFISTLEILPPVEKFTPDGSPGINLITMKGISIIPKRSLDTIWIDSEVKGSIVSQIEKFFSPEEKSFYREKGIYHKKTYLFTGLPGTGKTNFVRALASHFNKPLQTIDLSSPLFERGIEPSMILRKVESFILIEDIDTMFQRMGAIGSPGGPTISSIINMLDGMDSPEHVVLFITCNDSKILDLPSIRRGRINHVVEFDKMSKGLIRDMINSFFPQEEYQEKIGSIVKSLQYKQVLPCDLEAYILENKDNFDDFYKSITTDFKSSAALFKEVNDRNTMMSNSYHHPEGFAGVM